MRGILSFAALAAMYFPDVQRVKMRCIVSADGLKVVTRWSKNLYRQVTCRTITGF